MFKLCVIFAIVVSTTFAGVAKSKQNYVVLEPQAENSYTYNHYDGNTIGHHDYEGNKAIHGAELASLAHSSAAQAKTAVQNQHTAGSQAAFGVKSSLASAAYGAAQAALAALVGKRALVNSIRAQLDEAHQQALSEATQYQQTQAAAQAAEETAHQAQIQLQSLNSALAAAQAGAQHASQAASEASQSAAAQHAMLLDAKQRVAQLSAQLQNCLSDLQQTEAAAQKASESAHLAQSNAAAAGAAVSAHSEKGYGGYHH